MGIRSPFPLNIQILTDFQVAEHLKNSHVWGSGVEECLPRMYEALCSIPRGEKSCFGGVVVSHILANVFFLGGYRRW